MIMKILISFIFAILLVACGGSAGCNAAGALLGAAASSACSNSNNSSPTVATGYFIDSAVQGLTYISGSQSGITGADGSFKYDIGKPITFSIGGLTLGTVPIASGYITPIDLVSNGSITDQQVINITSFLMSLDSNQAVSDGIQLSSSTLRAAATWLPSQLNFNQPYSTFAAQALALTGFTLPSQTSAVAHLTSSLRCLQSGIFTGTFTATIGPGGTGGYFSDANTGQIMGAYIASDNSFWGLATSGNQDAISLDQKGTFSMNGGTSSGAVFSGSLNSSGISKFNNVSGSYISRVDNNNGKFIADRLGGLNSAKFRVSGYFQIADPDFLLYALDINLNNSISGKLYSVKNKSTVSISGSLSGNQITATATSGEVITATIDKTTGALSLVKLAKGAPIISLTSGSSGCLLNGFNA